MEIYPAIVMTIALAVFCGWYANRNGRSPILWGILGLVFPVVVPIILLIVVKSNPVEAAPTDAGRAS